MYSVSAAAANRSNAFSETVALNAAGHPSGPSNRMHPHWTRLPAARDPNS